MNYHQQRQTLERAKQSVGILETCKTFATEGAAIEYLHGMGFRSAPDYGYTRLKFGRAVRAEIVPASHKRFIVRYRKMENINV